MIQMFFQLLVLVITAAVLTESKSLQPENRVIYDFSNCNYTTHDNVLSWGDARTMCQSTGGFLVTINSPQTKTKIVQKIPLSWRFMWTGMNAVTTFKYPNIDDQYVWESGNVVTWFDWAVGEPQNRKQNITQYLNEPSIYLDKKLNWAASDHHLGGRFPYICEHCAVSPGKSITINKCNYFYHSYGATWPRAREMCKERNNGVLATVNSLEIQKAIIANRPIEWTKTEPRFPVWIGLHSEATSADHHLDHDVYVWESGVPFTYPNWANTEPHNRKNNTSGYQKEPYVLMDLNTGKLRDYGAEHVRYFICEQCIE